MNTYILLLAQIVGEMFGKRLDSGFRGVVSGVSGGIGDSLFGTGDDDGGGVGVGCYGGEEGVDAVYDTEEVYGEDLAEV